jgi:hypothetical protein
VKSKNSKMSNVPTSAMTHKKIMVLHGNRQTGEVLAGRMKALRRKMCNSAASSTQSKHNYEKIQAPSQFHKLLGKNSFELVAPDAPHEYLAQDIYSNGEGDGVSTRDDVNEEVMRTWWYREGEGEQCTYAGLQESLEMLHDIWLEQRSPQNKLSAPGGGFEGLFGFSQGCRLVYIISHLYSRSNGLFFPGLKYVIFSGGYGDVPLPLNMAQVERAIFDKYSIAFSADIAGAMTERVEFISIPSLHVIGLRDKIVLPSQSRALAQRFRDPLIYEFDGGHYVPMKGKDLEVFIPFITEHTGNSSSKNEENNVRQDPSPKSGISKLIKTAKDVYVPPDDDHALEHVSEVEALEAIYPDEFCLLSDTLVDDMGERHYTHPIEYTVLLYDPAQNEDKNDEEISHLWPPSIISLRVKYPYNYPDFSPVLSLYHTMNVMQFSSSAESACLAAVRAEAESELGMPCVMTCVLAAKDFFENGGLSQISKLSAATASSALRSKSSPASESTGQDLTNDIRSILGITADDERIRKSDEEGQQIANRMLSQFSDSALEAAVLQEGGESPLPLSRTSTAGSGGSWKYTIGLVGKPSAGKSTFFNAATAFARQQRDDGDDTSMFGASMAPHPFTTIDPNVGFCYLPAPIGSCPEDVLDTAEERFRVGSMHGRDPNGRRMLYATLKDVAGLVPGAYQGRGKGNKVSATPRTFSK